MTSAKFTVAVGGASGLVGSALVERLEQPEQGARVIRLVRDRSLLRDDTLYWSPATQKIDAAALEDVDVIVNLAGEAIGPKRWSKDRKERIVNSRVKGTALLSQTIQGLDTPPKVFIQASAVGYYGDTGDRLVDEQSPVGKGFLAGVCQKWEAATESMVQAGVRVVRLRFGHVLSKKGGLLQVMQTPFKAGVGGAFGNGSQYWSWIHIDDLVEIIVRSIHTATWSGPINTVTPNPVTNAAFAKELAKVLRRPSFVNVPATALKLAFGSEQAREMLLWGQRVQPAFLSQRDFRFQHPQLPEALQTLVG